MTSPFAHFNARVAAKSADAREAPVIVVALGDSVTQGCTALDVLEPTAVYHHRLLRLLEAHYPKCTFSVINAGVAGDSAPGALVRLERDVLRHAPDLLLIGFGLNDACGGVENGERFRDALRAIIGRVRQNGECSIVMLTPNFMVTRDNGDIAPAHREAGILERFMDVQHGGVLAHYAEIIRGVGRDCNVPVADVYAAWEAEAAKGVDVTALLSNGLNHPTAQAHLIPAQLLGELVIGS